MYRFYPWVWGASVAGSEHGRGFSGDGTMAVGCWLFGAGPPVGIGVELSYPETSTCHIHVGMGMYECLSGFYTTARM